MAIDLPSKEDQMKTKVVTAMLVLMFSSATFARTSKGLPFINDNFEKALVEAKQRNVPLFVDVWAPW
jgi:hypothetical protein